MVTVPYFAAPPLQQALGVAVAPAAGIGAAELDLALADAVGALALLLADRQRATQVLACSSAAAGPDEGKCVVVQRLQTLTDSWAQPYRAFGSTAEIPQ